jgi:hypothetical protein
VCRFPMGVDRIFVLRMDGQMYIKDIASLVGKYNHLNQFNNLNPHDHSIHLAILTSGERIPGSKEPFCQSSSAHYC